MTLRRVLILTSGPLSRNPRPLKEARTLAEHGYAVTVVTGYESDDLVEGDYALVADTAVTVIPLAPPNRVTALVWKIRTALARRIVVHLGWQLPSALGPATALLRLAKSIQSDLVIAHNELALWVARRLHRSGRRVSTDLEDWYSEDLLPSARRARPLKLLRSLEREALGSFAYTLTTSNALAAALHKAYGGHRAHVVPNTFPLQPLAPIGLNATPSLVWFSQTVGPGRGLEAFLAAWSATHAPSRLTLVGHCSPSFRDTLVALIRPEQVSRLLFHDLVPVSELPGLLALHDIGLALENHEPPSRELTTTNKIYQYLNAGLCIIATPTAGQREVFDQASGIGLICDITQTAKTTAQLEALFGNRAWLLSARQAARSAAEAHFSWEKTAPVLVNTVASAFLR